VIPAAAEPPGVLPGPDATPVGGPPSSTVERQGELDTDPRPNSRADRMRQPAARDVLRAAAERHGVCVRPVLLRRTDRETGRTEVIEVPCGARLASKCKPCAERNRRLRIQQISEGWHLDVEPNPPVELPGADVVELVERRADLEFERQRALMLAELDQVATLDEQIVKTDAALADAPIRGTLAPAERRVKPRRQRSTRRRQDAVDLPRLPVSGRTVGRAYLDADGQTRRPSTLLTVTLLGYGLVHTSVRRGA